MTPHPHVPAIPGTETLSSFERRTLKTNACSLHSIPDQQTSISTDDDRELSKQAVYGGNCTQRERWIAALHQNYNTQKLASRLQQCGHDAWVEQCQRTGAFRVVAPACKLRFCPRCSRIHARRTGARLKTWAQSVQLSSSLRLRLITLTVASSDQPLNDQLSHLYQSYRRLRQRSLWKNATIGSIAVLQITLNCETHRWHPHLHVIQHGRFIDYRTLTTAWKKASKGSTVIDIREVKSAQRASDYVTRYVARPLDDDPKIPLEKLREYVIATKGRRLLIAGGEAPLVLPEPPPDDHAWQHVDSLAGIIAAARLHSPRALLILESLPKFGADAPPEELPLFDLAIPDHGDLGSPDG